MGFAMKMFRKKKTDTQQRFDGYQYDFYITVIKNNFERFGICIIHFYICGENSTKGEQW